MTWITHTACVEPKCSNRVCNAQNREQYGYVYAHMNIYGNYVIVYYWKGSNMNNVHWTYMCIDESVVKRVLEREPYSFQQQLFVYSVHIKLNSKPYSNCALVFICVRVNVCIGASNACYANTFFWLFHLWVALKR